MSKAKNIRALSTYTEKTVLSNQQKNFVDIYPTKFFCCANKTFCYIK